MRGNTGQSRETILQDFVDWCGAHIKGDEKGEAQVFLDHLFRGFGQKGSLDVGGTPEMRIRPAELWRREETAYRRLHQALTDLRAPDFQSDRMQPRRPRRLFNSLQ